MVPAASTIERSRWISRLRAFVATGPGALPPPEALFEPSATQVGEVLLPLVARRTLKRLLRASLQPRSSADVATEWARLISALLELPDSALEALLVRPELAGLVARMEGEAEDERVLLPWLGQVVVAAMVAHGGDLGPTRVARSTPRTVCLPSAAVTGRLASSGSEPVVVAVRAGRLLASDVSTWRATPRLAERIDVSTRRDAWLERTFPGVEYVAWLEEREREQFMRSLEEAVEVLHGVWPQAHQEVLALLCWVVPLANLDSWYVPGVHGLIALSVRSERRQVRDLWHETSHHKLSRVLELASASRAPDHRVFSPFAKGKEPVSSLLQSCWAFAREYELIARLKASGYIEPRQIAREELKFRVLFEKGIPVLRREGQLTALGDAVLTSIEESVQ